VAPTALRQLNVSITHEANRDDEHHTRDQGVHYQRPLHAEVLEHEPGCVAENKAAQTASAR
jgi:hypothetical protein